MLAPARALPPFPTHRCGTSDGKRSLLFPVLGTILLLTACGGTNVLSDCELDGTYSLWLGSSVDRVRIEVEVADDDEERARGLMGRTRLGPEEGMVFLHEQPTRTGFWMKDTTIPLTIAFWGADRHVTEIRDMDPCDEGSCPLTVPTKEYVGALEVARGSLERLGIAPGDRVTLRAQCPR